MILEENFTMEHIEEIKESRKVDKNILERSIYALGLLEALARVGLYLKVAQLFFCFWIRRGVYLLI